MSARGGCDQHVKPTFEPARTPLLLGPRSGICLSPAPDPATLEAASTRLGPTNAAALRALSGIDGGGDGGSYMVSRRIRWVACLEPDVVAPIEKTGCQPS